MPDTHSVLVIGPADVRRLLPMERCIELMSEALSALARGQAANPLRSVMVLPFAPAAMGAMPGALADPPTLGMKVISVFPGNRAAGLESHQGFVLLFEAEHGRPIALVDAGAITGIRTAAVSGLATRLLSRADASQLGIIGSGTQARTHLQAMLAVRPITAVRAWSPNAERLRAFVDEASADGLQVEPAADARSAMEGADIVCTVSAARDPVVEGAWLAEGMHLNAVGSSQPGSRELDAPAIARARLFVDRRESALAESGELQAAMADGLVDATHIVAELGEVAAGLAPGRRDPGEITVFKSLGLAVEDVAAAAWVHRQALEDGAGTSVPLG
jgi:ornithine cyclodeaminase